MTLSKYIENGETKFELKQNELFICKGGHLEDSNIYSFWNETTNFQNLCLLEPTQTNSKNIEIHFYETIIIKDFDFGIYSIKIIDNVLFINLCFYTEDNHFRTSIDIKKLLKRFNNHNYKKVKLLEISDKEQNGDFSFQWEASFEFKAPIQYYIDKIVSEFEYVIDLELINEDFTWRCEFENDETLFTKEVLIPLFNLMDFNSVRFNHGTQEFGKDITFYDTDKFGNIEFYGVQVKAGDISGKVNSKLNEIITQINDAFNIPFKNIETGREEFLSKIIIANSGEYTENAKTKIMHNIPSYLRMNIRFLDKAKIITLIKKLNKNTT